MKPVIVINFKNYSESTGKNAIKLAKLAQKAAKKSRFEIILAVQASDIYPVAKSVKIPVFAQHIDSNSFGPYTGNVTAEGILAAGASGTLINHAEKRIALQDTKRCVSNCKRLKLRSMVCSDNLAQIRKIVSFEPTYIAFEDPALIGTLKSVSTYSSAGVRAFAKFMKGKKPSPVCGAGIADAKDLEESMNMGMNGILVATAIVKSKNPAKALRSLADANF
jgi:triosephosphate isomerase (TIM)